MSGGKRLIKGRAGSKIVDAPMVAVWLLIAMVLFTGTARADEGPVLPAEDELSAEDLETAEAHYRMAVELYARGRYRESVEEFDQVLEYHDDPIVHCNRAVPLIELGRLGPAQTSLERCLNGYDESSADYEMVSAELRALEMTRTVVAPRARRVIDEITTAEEAAAEAEEEERQATAPVVAPPVVDEAPQSGFSGVQVAGLVLLGTGAGLGTAAAVVDWRSADLIADFQQEAQGGAGTSPQRHRELQSQIETRQQIFWGLAATGAATGLVGAGLSLWGLMGDDEDQEISLQIGGQSIGARWQGRF